MPHIIAQARISGFTLAEVDHILRWEVRPALYHNYLDIAGEWAGWPKDWLVERILRAIETRPSAIIGQKRFMPDEWPQIQAAMS